MSSFGGPAPCDIITLSMMGRCRHKGVEPPKIQILIIIYYLFTYFKYFMDGKANDKKRTVEF